VKPKEVGKAQAQAMRDFGIQGKQQRPR